MYLKFIKTISVAAIVMGLVACTDKAPEPEAAPAPAPVEKGTAEKLGADLDKTLEQASEKAGTMQQDAAAMLKKVQQDTKDAAAKAGSTLNNALGETQQELDEATQKTKEYLQEQGAKLQGEDAGKE